jgi:hypothetical protein
MHFVCGWTPVDTYSCGNDSFNVFDCRNGNNGDKSGLSRSSHLRRPFMLELIVADYRDGKTATEITAKGKKRE